MFIFFVLSVNLCLYGQFALVFLCEPILIDATAVEYLHKDLYGFLIGTYRNKKKEYCEQLFSDFCHYFKGIRL